HRAMRRAAAGRTSSTCPAPSLFAVSSCSALQRPSTTQRDRTFNAALATGEPSLARTIVATTWSPGSSGGGDGAAASGERDASVLVSASTREERDGCSGASAVAGARPAATRLDDVGGGAPPGHTSLHPTAAATTSAATLAIFAVPLIAT